jgi:hypothetical protein
MQFITPIKFEDAIKKLGAKSPIGAKLSSREWSAVPVALRERAIWSATIESVRFAQDLKTNLNDFLEANRDPGTGALKVGSRAKFIEMMRRKAIAEGLGPIDPKDAGTIKDIRSERRLGLIFDINTKAAKAFGDRKQGLDPDVLNEFPGQRFIRVIDVAQERTAHQPYEGQVFLKTDIKMFLRINTTFGVPWGPYGFGCGHDTEDVDRDETDAIGLTRPGEIIRGAGDEDFNQHLKASVRNLDPELIRFLREKFGTQIKIENGVAEWRLPGEGPVAPTITPPPSPPVTPPPSPAITPPSENPNGVPSVSPGLAPSPTLGSQSNNTTNPEGVQSAWQQPLESLATKYKDAHYTQKEAFRDRARELLSVPEKLRQPVPVTAAPSGSKSSNTVAAIAKSGNNVIGQFVRPQLTQKTSVHVFHLKTSRAYYRHDQRGVYLNVGSDRSTAAHEIMHGIEQQNPDVLKAAAEFLLARRRLIPSPGGEGKGEGVRETPQSLKKLTGLPYSGFEIAIEDDWIKRAGTVYAGKVYLKPGKSHVLSTADGPAWSDIDATEVLTTGIERLLADPIEFYLHDPQWFHFIIETIGIGKSL